MIYEGTALDEALAELPKWSGANNSIFKEFTFDSYGEAVIFANAVAYLAGKANHHPDITVSYQSVLVALSSHDLGGVTGRDLDMAKNIEKLTSI